MNAEDCSTYQEWLDLECEGELPAAQAAALAAHLPTCAACRADREALRVLRRELDASRVEVPAGFSARVMAALPPAGWEARSPATWRLPLALLALLAGSAAALAGLSSAELFPGAPLVAAVAALGDLVATAALAGAGLLAASWSGLGLVVGDLFATSKGTLAAFVGLVAGVNLLLFFLLRRRPAAVEERSGSGRRGGRRDRRGP